MSRKHTPSTPQEARILLAIRLTKLAERTHMRPLDTVEIMHRHLDAARDEINARNAARGERDAR